MIVSERLYTNTIVLIQETLAFILLKKRGFNMSIDLLCTKDFGKDKMDKLRALGYNIIVKKEKNLVYSEELKDVEALITYNPFLTLDITKMKKLKWIQLFSNGIDQLPKSYLLNSSIIITNNKSSYNVPIAEWIILKILEIYKNSYSFYKSMDKQLWHEDYSLLELGGKVVGILGTGGIAGETAKRLKGFDVTILGYNTRGTQTLYFDKCYCKSEMNEMLKQCDIVINLLPGTKETYHIIGKERFEAMKEQSVFINVGRGTTVDEASLINYIENKKFRGVALDVFEKEPLQKDSKLWRLENVFVSPHNSWISEKNDEKIYALVYENMNRYTEKEELINLVNLSRGY